MLGHDGDVVHEFFVRDVGSDHAAKGDAAKAQQAEKLQRPRGIIEQKFNDDQVKKYA